MTANEAARRPRTVVALDRVTVVPEHEPPGFEPATFSRLLSERLAARFAARPPEAGAVAAGTGMATSSQRASLRLEVPGRAASVDELAAAVAEMVYERLVR